jgi:hypothetical protein
MAFIDQIVMECVSEHVTEYIATTPLWNGKSACDVILAESSRAKSRKLACGTPAWTQGHPFNKAFEHPGNLYKRWSGKNPKWKSVFGAVCPYIALLAPLHIPAESDHVSCMIPIAILI